MLTGNLTRLPFSRTTLEERLPEFLRARRWFGGKARSISAVTIEDAVPLGPAHLLVLRVAYQDGGHDFYALPVLDGENLAAIPGGQAEPHIHLGGDHVLYDAGTSSEFAALLLSAIRNQAAFPGTRGEVRAHRTDALPHLAPDAMPLSPRSLRAEQSNTSIAYGDRLVLKMFRRLERGENPDLEVGRFLTEHTSYRNVPMLAGYLEYVQPSSAPISLAVLQAFVPNRGDAWEFSLEFVRDFLRRSEASELRLPDWDPELLLRFAPQLPAGGSQLANEYLPWARLLGQRTAELHLALAGGGDPAFDPEPYSASDRQAFCSYALEMMERNFGLLRQQAPALPGDVQAKAEAVLAMAPQFERKLRDFAARDVAAQRIRIHGDYHLGQVLVSGEDFVILDFEGEPARPLAERRRKQSPLQDVAGMLRSFHYAAYAPLLGAGGGGPIPAQPATLPLASYWQMAASAAFLQAYASAAGQAEFLPREPSDWSAILFAHLLEKAVYELGYELNHRPTWVRIPLNGILQLAGGKKEG